MKFCITCGEPSEATRCTEHHRETRQARRGKPKLTAHQQGYDSRWTRLSKRARKLQPWCTDCGATTELQADHSPEAWERYYAGKAIRLQDIDVVCRDCNNARGQAHPGGRGLSTACGESAPVGHDTITHANGSHQEGVRVHEGRPESEGR